MAALITQETGRDAEVVPGGRGEFSVWVGGAKVAEKSRAGFPADADLIAAVKGALGPS